MKKGFTLIELLVVIAIMGILGVLIILRVTNSSNEARISRRKAEMAEIDKAIEIFLLNGGKLNVCDSGPLGSCTNSWYLRVSNNDLIFVANGDNKYPNDYLQGSDYPTQDVFSIELKNQSGKKSYCIRFDLAAAPLPPLCNTLL